MTWCQKYARVDSISVELVLVVESVKNLNSAVVKASDLMPEVCAGRSDFGRTGFGTFSFIIVE